MHEQYSESWWDIVYELKDKIEKDITVRVNDLTEGIDPLVDEQVRTMITETYRFWRE